MHILLDKDFPDHSLDIKLTVEGLARLNPHAPKRASPLTPDIMLEIERHLDLSDEFQVTMWAMVLLGFFTLSRKSQLVVTGRVAFDKTKQLVRGDGEVRQSGLLVKFRWSKRNQFGARVLQVPVLSIPGSTLCPLKTYKRMQKMVAAGNDNPAFCLPGKRKLVLITYVQLKGFIKAMVTKVGLNPGDFSTHSLRRASATWAFKANVRGELIKVQGDWASEAYLWYLEFSLDQRMVVARRMTEEIVVLEGRK